MTQFSRKKSKKSYKVCTIIHDKQFILCDKYFVSNTFLVIKKNSELHKMQRNGFNINAAQNNF